MIDLGNYHPELRDGRIEAIEQGLLDSEWVAAAARLSGDQSFQQHPGPEPAREAARRRERLAALRSRSPVIPADARVNREESRRRSSASILSTQAISTTLSPRHWSARLL